MFDTNQFVVALLGFLGASVIFVPLFKKIGLESILGYMAAGLLLGPWGLKLITNVEGTLHAAEMGVVFLLFLIGLELQPRKLWLMRYKLIGLGGLQILFGTLALSFFIWTFHFDFTTSLLIAFGLALSSTAFTLQALGERNELNTEYGRSAFAILLMQDLAAIPILALVPVLFGEAHNSKRIDILFVIGTLVGFVVLSRFVVRPFFRFIAKTHNREIFTSAALFLVIGIAAWMEHIGLSMALGTFLAGVLLADSEFKHAIEADIAPFKGLLMGLFFVAVGMSIDFAVILAKPTFLLMATISYLFMKILVVYIVGRVFRLQNEAAKNMALSLAQGSEFAFVLFALYANLEIISGEVRATLILIVTLSMILNPLLLVIDGRYFKKFYNRKEQEKKFDQIQNEGSEVIIAGFGRFGQVVGRMLRIKKIRFTALDHDSEQIDVLRRFGNKVFYGDASRVDLLEAAGAAQAKVFVLAIDDVEASLQTAQAVIENFPNLKVYARARNRGHAFKLMDLGLTHIKREVFDSSLEFAKDIMSEFGLSKGEIEDLAERFKEYDEKTLIEQQKVHKSDELMVNVSKQAAQQFYDTLSADTKNRDLR